MFKPDVQNTNDQNLKWPLSCSRISLNRLSQGSESQPWGLADLVQCKNWDSGRLSRETGYPQNSIEPQTCVEVHRPRAVAWYRHTCNACNAARSCLDFSLVSLVNAKPQWRRLRLTSEIWSTKQKGLHLRDAFNADKTELWSCQKKKDQNIRKTYDFLFPFFYICLFPFSPFVFYFSSSLPPFLLQFSFMQKILLSFSQFRTMFFALANSIGESCRCCNCGIHLLQQVK